MCIYSKEFYKKTVTVWQPFSSSVLSEEETKEITENITELFTLLLGWKNEDEGKKGKYKEKE